MPVAIGKAVLWRRIVRPGLVQHPRKAVTRTIYGTTLLCDTKDHIPRRLYAFGVWEPDLSHWLVRRLKPGDVFIDAGAHIGYFTLLASRLVGPSGSVVAIEASPAIFLLLTDNLARNRAANVSTVNAAASHHAGMVSLFAGPDTHTATTTTFPVPHGTPAGPITALPLREILNRQEIETARVIKIDVEGDEWSVIRDLAPVLDACRPDLEVVVEVHPEDLARRAHRPEDLVRVFLDRGFHLYRLEPGRVEHLLHRVPTQPPVRVRDAPEASITERTLAVFSREDAEQL